MHLIDHLFLHFYIMSNVLFSPTLFHPEQIWKDDLGARLATFPIHTSLSSFCKLTFIKKLAEVLFLSCFLISRAANYKKRVMLSTE